MLVLRRRTGERILIDGGRITIEVTAAGDDWAKFGITAPPEVNIAREELLHLPASTCLACGQPTCWRSRTSHPAQMEEDARGKLHYDDSLDHPAVAPCGPEVPTLTPPAWARPPSASVTAPATECPMPEFRDQLYLASGQSPGEKPQCQCQSCSTAHVAESLDFRHFLADLRRLGWSVGFAAGTYTYLCPTCTALARAQVRAAATTESADPPEEPE